MFGGFGVLSPAYLMLIPAVLAGLLYAYRKGGRGKEIIVSTLLIFKKLTVPPRSRQKFWPPPRFFLEVLLLIGLSFAAAGLSQEGYKSRYGILVDNSLSMSALNKNGDMLLDIAKRDAKTFLGGLAFGDGAKVCVTSPTFYCFTEEVIDAGRASDKIDDVQFVYGEDEIDQALATLLSDPTIDKVVLVSDKLPANLEKQNPRVLIRSSAELVEPLQNIAITGVRVDRSENERTLKVGITVAAFSSETVKLTALVNPVEIINEELKSSTGSRKELSVPAGGVTQAEFTLPEAAGYSFTLQFPDRTNSNSISSDDHAFVAPKVSRGGGVLISQFSSKELGLDRISSLSFQDIKPNDPNISVKESNFIIYHNVTTTELPDTNALYINPLNDGPFFSLLQKNSEAREQNEVTSWDESNPITSYLKLSLLNFLEFNSLKSSLGASAVVTTNQGPVLLGLEKNGKRYAAVGFELLPFKGNSSPVLSILTLNILKWISGQSISAGYEEVPFLLPNKKTIEAPEIFLDNDGTTRAFNYFSESESDTLTEQRFIITPEITNSNSDISNARTLGPSIVFGALLLCLLDLLLQVIQSFRRRRARA